jgi:UDP-GlcNAc:undecaprenyl-phosphate/decaprenyl-phosphate GlcNAc-1-phosphate transferase
LGVKILQLLGFGLGGMFLSILCNELLLRFSKSLGIRNKNDVIVRWSNESKPSLGGVSFFVVFVFTALAYSFVFYDENIFHYTTYKGLILSGSMAFIMGLADDAYNTRPMGKLLIQFLCGLVFVYCDITIQLFDSNLVNDGLTVIWVIGIMNSLNMLDNMDGITGTTVLSILLSCLLVSWIIYDFNSNIWTINLVAIIGALIGFLWYNVNPSKLFMGDAGSQFIGLFVAFFSIKNLWNMEKMTQDSPWLGAVVVLIAFTPAAVDTITVVVNRLKKGQSPMVGGKDHTTHHLVYAGLSDLKVWYVFLFLGIFSLVFTFFGVLLFKNGYIFPLAIGVVFFLLVLIVLYRNTILYKKSN